jgi:hypothetical protein
MIQGIYQGYALKERFNGKYIKKDILNSRLKKQWKKPSRYSPIFHLMAQNLIIFVFNI